jgi:GGDEF domain-containing protein
LLKEMADPLRKGPRASDAVARMGGDEFVVLLMCVDSPPNHGLVAQAIIACLSMPVTLDGMKCKWARRSASPAFRTTGSTRSS